MDSSVVRGHLSGLSCSSRRWKLLRSFWHLFHLAFVHCGRTWRDASQSISLPSHIAWYHLIPSFHRHHWSRTLILWASLVLTAQQSELYRKVISILNWLTKRFINSYLHEIYFVENDCDCCRVVEGRRRWLMRNTMSSIRASRRTVTSRWPNRTSRPREKWRSSPFCLCQSLLR